MGQAWFAVINPETKGAFMRGMDAEDEQSLENPDGWTLEEVTEGGEVLARGSTEGEVLTHLIAWRRENPKR